MKVAIVLVLVAVMLASLAAAAVLSQKSVTNHAGINAVGSISLWQNAECTVPLTSFDWGDDLVASQALSHRLWIKNDGNVPLGITKEVVGFEVQSGTSFYSPSVDVWNFKFTLNGGADWSIPKTLDAGAVMTVEFNLNIGANPAAVDIDWTVTFTGSEL